MKMVANNDTNAIPINAPLKKDLKIFKPSAIFVARKGYSAPNKGLNKKLFPTTINL